MTVKVDSKGAIDESLSIYIRSFMVKLLTASALLLLGTTVIVTSPALSVTNEIQL